MLSSLQSQAILHGPKCHLVNGYQISQLPAALNERYCQHHRHFVANLSRIPEEMHPYIAVPATGILLLRAYRKKSLTPAGLGVAGLTAVIHAIHPWSCFFTLLGVFFLSGTFVTKVSSSMFLHQPGLLALWQLLIQPLICVKVKHDVKARLTLSSSGASGGEGSRTHIQVLANSVVASVLILLHYRQLLAREKSIVPSQDCWPYGEDLLVIGIVRY